MKLQLFKNARIYAFYQNRLYNWLVTSNGKILALGTKNEAWPALPYDRINDLQNQTVLPAFGDAHLHTFWMIRRFFEIDLSQTRSLNEVLSQLKAFAGRGSGRGQWIIGRGFNKNFWPDGLPHRKYLDALFPDRPVFLETQDCHAAWLNSEALRRCGIHERTPQPEGGFIEKDAQGQPTGMLYDRALQLVSGHLPELDEQMRILGAERLLSYLYARGITSVHTMEDTGAFAFWQSFLKTHPESLRLTVFFQHEELESLLQAGLRSGFGNEWLRIGGIKLFSDGSLGAQTALLSRPYAQSRENYGLAVMPETLLRERIRLAECNGLAVAVHAIGDLAVERVLKALRQTESCRKKFGLTSRIEHAQLIRPELLPLFKQFGLMASMQPLHIADDVPTAERYWGARSRWAYAFRSLLEAGVPLAFGSDAPVAEPDPLKGVFCAVNRRFRCSADEPIWYPQERLSVEEALHAFTMGVARAANVQSTAGTLEVGKNADFVVLNNDPFRVADESLLKLSVERTFLAGEQVFEAPS